jgi:hypothetical protein
LEVALQRLPAPAKFEESAAPESAAATPEADDSSDLLRAH